MVVSRVASALVAAVGSAESFDHGRDLAAWLGLAPHPNQAVSRRSSTADLAEEVVSKQASRCFQALIPRPSKNLIPHDEDRRHANPRPLPSLELSCVMTVERGQPGHAICP